MFDTFFDFSEILYSIFLRKEMKKRRGLSEVGVMGGVEMKRYGEVKGEEHLLASACQTDIIVLSFS